MRLQPANYPQWVNYEQETICPWEIRVGDYVDILGSRVPVVDLDVARKAYSPEGRELAMDAVVRGMAPQAHKDATLLVELTLWTLYFEGGQSITIYGNDMLHVWRFKLGAGSSL